MNPSKTYLPMEKYKITKSQTIVLVSPDPNSIINSTILV